MPHAFTGQHLLLAYEGCEADLDDAASIEAAMREGVIASGAEIRASATTRYEPQGLSIVVLIAESHASIHTYPEHRSAFLDIFTCGTTCSPERFDAVLRRHLRPGAVRSQLVVR
jgi:S-adenosylmethionine decarboxylase